MTRNGYSINDLDNMIPYELDFFIAMLNNSNKDDGKKRLEADESTF